MAKLNIVSDDGVLLKQIDLSDYNLSKPLARVDLIFEIIEALKDEKNMEDYNQYTDIEN